MRGGPVLSYELHWTLQESTTLQGGTAATVRLEIVPRFWFLRPIAWLNARRFGPTWCTSPRPSTRTSARRRRARTSSRCRPPTPSTSPRGRGDEQGRRRGGARREARRFRARRRRRRPRAHPSLRAGRRGGATDARCSARSSRAVPAGLFEMRWGIICPSCLTRVAAGARARGDHRPRATASSATSPSSSTSIAPSRRRSCRTRRVRRVPDALFCIGGPRARRTCSCRRRVEPGDDARRSTCRASRGATACSRAAARRRRSRWTSGAPSVVDARLVDRRRCSPAQPRTPRPAGSCAIDERAARTRGT